MAINDLFISSIFGKNTSESISVKFKNGSTADYTTDIFSLLVSDPATDEIISNETGELYFSSSDGYIAYPANYR